jgi:hypothetical protein
MAINIQYPGSIAAMGQVAIQGGEYAGQQQALQNQLAVGGLDLRRQQLAQQGQQFNADMNFRRKSMLFNDYQQQRNFAQQVAANRESQVRGIKGNLMSQQLANQSREQYQLRQFAYGASQNAVQFEQRKELLDLQDQQSNASRDLDFKRQKEYAQFQDEITREKFEYQYTFQQQKELEKYENSIHEMETGDYSQEEKMFAINQLRAKMMGIQPTPRALQQKFAPDKGFGELWDEGKWTWTRGADGVPVPLVEKTQEPELQMDEDGSTFYADGKGKVMTVSESPYSVNAWNKERDNFYKILQSQQITEGKGEDAMTRPMTLDEIQSAADKHRMDWEVRKSGWMDQRASQFRAQKDAQINANQKMLNQSQYQSNPGRSEMIMPEQKQQPQFNMEAVRNAVSQGVTIPPEQADQAGLPQPRLPEHYQQIPDGTPYYDLSNGKIKIKGEDGGFSLDSPKKIGANQRAALDKWKEIVKRDESGKYRGMRIEDK